MKAKAIHQPAPTSVALDFAEMKSLCRYYYAVKPTATVSDVLAYRDVWENDEPEHGRAS